MPGSRVPDNPDLPGDVPLVALRRGGLTESVHRGRAVTCDPRGTVLENFGDPEAPTYLRSSAKPFQALPLVLSGAADALGLTGEEVAVACGSHSGEESHVRAVRSILDKAGLSEEDLRNGTHPPLYAPEAAKLAARGEEPRRVHGNCSGKHAGMLAVCAYEGWSTTGYRDRDHPLQQRILELVATVCGVAADRVRLGGDGCGVPAFALPLRGLATGFARLATGEGLPEEVSAAARVIREAVRDHPHMVAGTGRFDTQLMRRTELIAKSGAEAVFAAASPDGRGFALKISDGAGRAVPPAALALLGYPEAEAGGLEDRERPAVRRPRRRAGRGTATARLRSRIHPMERMLNYTELGPRETIVLGTALETGLLRAVADEPRTPLEAARELELDGRAVYAVLSALEELGIVAETEAGFGLREEHRGPLLDERHPEYAGAGAVHRMGLIQRWTRLPEVLVSGEPVEDRTAAGFEGSAAFTRAMRREALPGAEGVAEVLSRRLPGLCQGARLLDVGGGPGANAEAFRELGARVTVFDREEVIEDMREHFREAGIEAVGGDMNEWLPDGPFDVVYLGHTSHMYGPEENRRLMVRLRGPLAPGGTLVIRDFVRGLSEEAALFAVNMLLLTPAGGTYTARDYGSWLVEAGFEEPEIEPVPGRGTHLILARKP